MKDIVETKNCISCGVELVAGENFYPKYIKKRYWKCKSCHAEINARTNAERMYVGGKHISKYHPLYKPGRYKSFGDAAFAALQKQETVKEGYVYAITNPAWPEWIKIGMAIDAEDRLNGYQTSSPMRDYSLLHHIYSDDRSVTERAAHKLAAKLGERSNEWFKITHEQAIQILEGLKQDD